MEIIAIALKDVLRSMRNSFFIGMAVAAPLLLTGLMYFAFGAMNSGSAGLPALKVGIVNGDTLPTDSPLEEPLGATIRAVFFDQSVSSWIAASDYPDAQAARAAVDSQELGTAVVIPAGFSADFLAGSPTAKITLIQDPTLTITPLIVRSMLTSLLDGISGGKIAYQIAIDRRAALGVSAEPGAALAVLSGYQAWYTNFERDLFHNPGRAALVMRAQEAGESKDANGIAGLMKFIMAGQMIFFAFYTGGFAMMSIIQEQEEGTLARLFTTPINRTTVLAGKFLAVVITVTLQGLVLMVAAHFAFQVDWGEPGAVAIALLAQVIAASGLGVLLISIVKSTRQGGVVLGGVLSAMGMVSGLFTVAVPSAAAALETVARFTPQGWVLATWTSVLNGQPAGQALMPLAVCTGFGIVTFAAGAFLFRRRFI